MTKYKGDTDLLSIVDIYKLVLTGKLNRFPNFTWSESDRFDNGAKCTRYLIEEVLKWNDKEVKENLSLVLIRRHKLSGMMSEVFGNSPYYAINTAYPNKFKPWEFKMAPLNTWDTESSIDAFKWLIEDKLKWTREDIIEKLSLKVLIDNKLGGMMETLYSNSPFAILNKAYPGEYMIWEMSVVPASTWDKETCIESFKWLIEEKLKWGKDEMIDKLSREVVTLNGFSGMLSSQPLKNSLRTLVKWSYPDLDTSGFKCFKRYVNKDKAFARKEIRRIIEKKTKGKKSEIKKINYRFFIDNDLGSYLSFHYENSPYKAMEDIYSGLFKPWEIGANVPKGFWNNKDNIIEAVKWLVEDKLEIEPQISPLILTIDIFLKYNLSGLLKGITIPKVLELTYPDIEPLSTIEIYELILDRALFKYPAGFWDENSLGKVIELLKYLIDEKLKLTEDEVYAKYTHSFLKEYRLNNIAEKLNIGTHELITLAYTDKFKIWKFKNISSKHWTADVILDCFVQELKEANIPKKEWVSTINTRWIKEKKLGKLIRGIGVEDIRNKLGSKSEES